MRTFAVCNNYLLDEILSNTNLFMDILTSQAEKTHGYPFCNVKRGKDQDSIIVELAVVGFNSSELDIEVHDGVLKVTGTKQKQEEAKYFFKGISTKSFVKKFPLSEYHVVENASVENGLLSITVKTVIPDSKKPVKVKIGGKFEEQKSSPQVLNEGE